MLDKRRSYLKGSGKQAGNTDSEGDDVSTVEENNVTPRSKQPVRKLQTQLDDGIQELNSSDDPGWTQMDVDDKSSEDKDIDMDLSSDDLERAPKKKRSKSKATSMSKVRGGGKTSKGTHGFRDAIMSERETRRKSEVKSFPTTFV